MVHSQFHSNTGDVNTNYFFVTKLIVEVENILKLSTFVFRKCLLFMKIYFSCKPKITVKCPKVCSIPGLS